MLRMLTGATLGLLLGWALADALGAALGVFLGLALGRAWQSIAPRAARRHEGPTTTRRERLLCVPRGEVADCTLVRDERSGRYLDVERCSLRPEAAPACPKECLTLMNEVAQLERPKAAAAG